MSVKWKNAVGILLIVVIVAAIVAGVTVAALDENKKTSEVEYFIDYAPVDYSAAENVIYVRSFRDTVEGIMSLFAEELHLTQFADRALTAASLARIPAYKLDGISTAIRQIEPSAWGETVFDLSDEQIKRLASLTTSSVLRNAVSEFFSISGLTTREFAAFLYEYQNLYGVAEYKAALSILGKDTFIDLVGSTLFLIVRSSNVGEGAISDAHALLAAFYEYGETLKQSYSRGSSALLTATGLRFTSIDETDAHLPYLNAKTPYLFALAGYVFSEIGLSSAEAIVEKRLSGTDYAAYSSLAKDLYRGATVFIERYGADFAQDYDELSAVLVRYFDEANRANYASIDVDTEREEIKTYLNERTEACEKFFTALRSLAIGGEYTEEQKAEQIADFAAFSNELNVLCESMFSLWVVQRAGEIGEEAV